MQRAILFASDSKMSIVNIHTITPTISLQDRENMSHRQEEDLRDAMYEIHQDVTA
jgi:hypothetical protein